MEGLGVVYEQEEPTVDNQQTPAGDNQAVVTSVPSEETEDDEEIRALAGNPDDLDAAQQLQAPPQQIPQHHNMPGSYADYTQSSGQHPQQQMEHHGGYDKNGGSTQPGKLFIGGVSWETTEDTLRQHFGKYGALTDAALMKDKYTGQPRGFGFVTFADASAIDRVLEETHTLDGRSVEVKRAIPREKTAPGSRLVSSHVADARLAAVQYYLLEKGKDKGGSQTEKGRKEGREIKQQDEKKKKKKKKRNPYSTRSNGVCSPPSGPSRSTPALSVQPFSIHSRGRGFGVALDCVAAAL